MTTLQKIELSGIRLFKEDNEPQTIDFGPITLITGDNGVGKSTIIEALQFATLGKCPNELITIPSMWEKETTNSTISLYFNSANNINYHITLNPSISKFKNDKGTLQKGSCQIESEVQTNPITIKTNDISTTISQYFRTSPAILKNVIFCNQKNTFWPIDDAPSKLKKKFDGIFNTAAYDNAIKTLKEINKDLEEDYKNIEIDEATCNGKYEQYKDHVDKKSEKNNEIENIMKKIEEKKIELQEIKKPLNIYNEIKPIIKNFDEEIQKKEGQLISEKNTINSLREKIQNLQPESICESSLNSIQLEILSITEKINSTKQNFNENEENSKKLEKEKNEIKDKINQISRNLDNVKYAEDTYSHSLKEFKNKYSTDDFDSILSLKENQFKKTQVELDACKGQKKIDLDQKNEELTNLMTNRAKEEANIENCKHEIETNRLELAKIGEIDENEVNEKKKMKQEASQSFIDFVSNKRIPQVIENEINETKKELEEAEQELKLFEQNKNDLQKVENFESQIIQWRETIEKQINIIKEKLDDQSIVPENLKKNVEEKVKNLKKEIKELKAELSQTNSDLLDVKYKLKQEQSSFDISEEETKDAEDKILKVLFNSIENFDNEYQSNEIALNSENQNLAIFTNNLALYNRYLEESKKTHCCPLCKRRFDSEDEYKSFISNELSSVISKIPDEIENCEKKINLYQSRIKDLKSISDDVKKYNQNNFTREEKVNLIISLQDKELKLSNKFNEITDQIEMKQNILEKFESITENVIIVDMTSQKLEKATKQHGKIIDKIGDSLLSADEINKKEKSLKEKVSNLQQTIINLNFEKADYSSELSFLERQEYQAEQNFELINNKYESKIKLNDSIDSIQKDINKKNENLKILKEKIDLLSNEKSELSDLYSIKIEELENKLDEDKNEYNYCLSLIKKIRESKETSELNDSNEILRNLKDLKIKFDKKTDEFNQVNKTIPALHHEIETLKEKQNDLTNKKDDLLNQQNYYNRIKLYDSINQELEELKKERSSKLGELNEIEIDEINSKYQSIEKELTILKANEQSIAKQIEEHENDIKRFEPSVKELQKIRVRKSIIEKSRNDIERYYETLDEMIIKYHEKKMEDINNTIQYLWQNIYYGQDIDSIAIRCDRNKKSGNANYNYHVVMIRNGRELTMSNHGSAGQKALACIIIRLALAQIFALSCPIIALDEPTTNLDKFNIANLAMELVKLSKISGSNNFKPFQIIIITHNIDFMNKLAEEGMIDSFYQIVRTKDSHSDYSKIEKCKEIGLIFK